MKRSRFHKGISSKQLRDLDLQTAIEIAGYAGIEVRDRKGNLSSDVWVRHSDKMSVGKLIEAADLRQLLLDQLKGHLNQQKDLLEQLEDDEVVVQWVLKFIDTWENAYQTRVNRNFDISQKILTAMQDAVVEIRYVLTDVGVNWNMYSEVVDELANQNLLVFPTEHAMVRYLFRNEVTGPPLRRLAGKILQKTIVCNKAGTYSAKVQRNDVTQEKAHALRDFIVFCQENPRAVHETFEMLRDADNEILLTNVITTAETNGPRRVITGTPHTTTPHAPLHPEHSEDDLSEAERN